MACPEASTRWRSPTTMRWPSAKLIAGMDHQQRRLVRIGDGVELRPERMALAGRGVEQHDRRVRVERTRWHPPAPADSTAPRRGRRSGPAPASRDSSRRRGSGRWDRRAPRCMLAGSDSATSASRRPVARRGVLDGEVVVGQRQHARRGDRIAARLGGGIDVERRATSQGDVDGGEDLVDADLAVVVDVARGAARQRRRVERDVDHAEQVIDRDRAVAAAVACAQDLGPRGRRKDGEKKPDDDQVAAALVAVLRPKRRLPYTRTAHLSSISRPHK